MPGLVPSVPGDWQKGRIQDGEGARGSHGVSIRGSGSSRIHDVVQRGVCVPAGGLKAWRDC